MFLCQRCASRLTRHEAKLIVNGSSASGHELRRPFHSSSLNGKVRHDASRQTKSTGHSHNAITGTKHSNARYSTMPITSGHARIAIIGSGPAGFYTAARLMKRHPDVKTDMYERLPVPYGLVRYGVAPDHPEVKNVHDTFDRVAESKNFEFVGNVDVGGDLPIEVLRRHYDAIVFAYGASEDRLLGIEGEDLKGVWSARSFVAWYNGLPGYEDLDFDLTNAENALVIGQGNVALDVARILLSPVDGLRKTDIPEQVLQKLSESNVKHVIAIGRRGPLQAAFTIKEIRELTQLPAINFKHVDPTFFPKDLKTLPRARRRIAELLLKQNSISGNHEGKSFELEFMKTPIRLLPASHPVRETHLAAAEVQEQSFACQDQAYDPTASVKPVSNSISRMSSKLLFRSIGYKSTPLHGLEKLGIQFNTSRGIIPNEGGRAVAYPASQPGIDVIPHTLPGLYVAGWVKRGPTGVIASTMEDAFATADTIGQDLQAQNSMLNGKISEGVTKEGWHGVLKEMTEAGRHVRTTNWGDWLKIDAVERERGKKLGKEREKIVKVAEMLDVLC